MRLLVFAVLLFASPARAESVRPLQFHCGVQPRAESGDFLAYGVAALAAGNETFTAVFQRRQAEGGYHPFCAVLAKAIQERRSVEVERRPQGELWVLLDVR